MRITQSKIALFIILYACFISTAAHADGKRTQRYEGTLHSVTLDTVSLSQNEKSADFYEVFRMIDSLARTPRLSAYFSYMLNRKHTYPEVEMLGRSWEAFQVPVDRQDPKAGTMDSLGSVPFRVKDVKRIVIAYETIEVMGILIPDMVSLSILNEYGPGMQQCVYALNYHEVLELLTVDQIKIFERFLMDSQKRK